MLPRISHLLICLLMTFTVFAQKSGDLKEKRDLIKQEIEKTSSEIQSTTKKRKTTYQQFLDLKKNISSKQEMVKELEGDIEQIDERIGRQQDVVNSLAADMGLMKARYSVLLRKAYRAQQSNHQFLFLFSASDFNDFVQRWRFLKQYHNFKNRQVDLIKKTQIALSQQNKRLNELQTEKTEVIKHVTEAAKRLGIAIKKKERTVRQLTEKEKELKVKLAKFEKARGQLNSQIEHVIYAELKATRKKNRTSRGIKSQKLSKKDEKIAKAFRSKKGLLQMPVKGKIVGKFGLRIHAEANNTKTESPGIDIKTSRNESVAVVHDGIVIRVFYQPEFQNIVLVRHGDYFTLYSNLRSTVIKKGTKVNRGDIIGKVGTQSGKTELHFQVWKNSIKLNPENWLKK